MNSTVNFSGIKISKKLDPTLRKTFQQAAEQVNHKGVHVVVAPSKVEKFNGNVTKVKAQPFSWNPITEVAMCLHKKPYKSVRDFNSSICLDRAKSMIESQVKNARAWANKIK